MVRATGTARQLTAGKAGDEPQFSPKNSLMFAYAKAYGKLHV
jgi:hypothetical protein